MSVDVGSLKKDTALASLYFSDNCFDGIPSALRIKKTDWSPMPQFDYDTAGNAKPVPNSVGGINFKAYDEGLVKQVQGISNKALVKKLLAGLGLLDFATVIPDDTTPDYQSLVKWVNDIQTQFDDKDNEGKDLILSDVECHVYPIALRGKGNFNKFQGVELRLCNPLKAKVSFADPVK